MTTAELVTRIQLYCGNRHEATSILVLAMANERQRQLALTFFFDEFETINAAGITTADGTRRYTKPTNDIHIVTMRITTDGYESNLVEEDWEEYSRNFDELIEGPPTHWAIHEGAVYLRPIPDGIYAMETSGLRLPPDMVSGGQAPYLPIEWHPPLAILTAADILFMLQDVMASMTLKNEGMGWISAIPERRTLRRHQTSSQANPKRIKPGG